MIIDFHTHSFPDSLAPRAMEVLKKNCSGREALSAHTDGTALDAKNKLLAAGIDRAVVCNIATNPRQEANVNGYAISLLSDPFFIPLGSVHPESENKESELDRLLAAGIKGVKLHPDYVRIPLSDGGFDRIFSMLTERGMFAVIHAGLDPVSPDKIHATPDMIKGVMKRHPTLRLVAAHSGGMCLGREVLDTLVGSGVYIDTSLSSVREDEWETLYKLYNSMDGGRILFGTDTPWSDPSREIAFIRDSALPEGLKRQIFSENALELLK